MSDPREELLRRQVKGLIVRACPIVAAQRLDLSGLGIEDLQNLAAVVRHMESSVHRSRTRLRRGY